MEFDTIRLETDYTLEVVLVVVVDTVVIALLTMTPHIYMDCVSTNN